MSAPIAREQSARPRLRDAVAAEIRAELARRNITRSQVGRLLGKSHTYVWRRIRGEIPFDLDDLEIIAGMLGIPPAALLPGYRPLSDTPQVSDTRWYRARRSARSRAWRGRRRTGAPRTLTPVACAHQLASA